jgi:hypothetical protein
MADIRIYISSRSKGLDLNLCQGSSVRGALAYILGHTFLVLGVHGVENEGVGFSIKREITLSARYENNATTPFLHNSNRSQNYATIILPCQAANLHCPSLAGRIE